MFKNRLPAYANNWIFSNPRIGSFLNLSLTNVAVPNPLKFKISHGKTWNHAMTLCREYVSVVSLPIIPLSSGIIPSVQKHNFN